MAFDKVIDSAQLDTDLASVANTIREKAKTSDALSFPAGFAEAIAALSTGSEFSHKMTFGQFNVTEEQAGGNFLIEHGLGAIPNVVLCYSDNPELTAGTVRGFLYFNLGELFDEEFGYYPAEVFESIFTETSSAMTRRSAYAETYTDRETFEVPSYNDTYVYVPAYTYTWIAIRSET